MKLWIVYKQSRTTHGIEDVAAFFNEDSARWCAHELVGGDYVVGLRTIEVKDQPPAITIEQDDAMFSSRV